MPPKKPDKPRGTHLYSGPANEDSGNDDALDEINRLRQEFTLTEQALRTEITSLREEVAAIKERLEEIEKNEQ